MRIIRGLSKWVNRSSSDIQGVPAADLLIVARSVIQPRNAWVKCQRARADDGRTVDPASSEAVAWCMSGAFRKAVSEVGAPQSVASEAMRALREATKKMHPWSGGFVLKLNDALATSHRQVLAVYDSAILDLTD